MRVSALLTWILLGAGVAAAEPKRDVAPPKPQAVERTQEQQSGRLRLQEPKKAGKIAKQEAPRQPGEWLMLADPTPAKHGTEFVVVGAQQGSFNQLRINAAKGTTTVRSVRVTFSDGTTKNLKVGATLSEKGRKFTDVNLGDSKPIAQLEVTTDRKGGEYTVYGSSGGATPGTVVSSR